MFGSEVFWPGWEGGVGPIARWRARPHLHHTNLTAPSVYSAGPRRPFFEDVCHNFGLRIPFLWNVPTLHPVSLFNGNVEVAAAFLHRNLAALPPPAQLNVTYTVKSQEAEVNWSHPHVQRNVAYNYEVSVEGGWKSLTQTFPQWRTFIRLRVAAGTWYKVHVRTVVHGCVIAQGFLEFKSVFNRDEMIQLYTKAAAYCGNKLKPFQVFYRNKPKPYWDDIIFNRGNVVERYIKDKNGQSASPINDTVYGLFFSSNLVNGRLPPTSPFGDVRLIVDGGCLLSPRHQLYFADFYCYSSIHYVTVVICVAGSDTDRYCARTLVSISPDSNPFLRVVERGPGWLEHYVNPSVWVEAYFTENVPVDWGYFDTVRATGQSTPGGLPNNKHCLVCNLYPVRTPTPAQIKQRHHQTTTKLSNSVRDDFSDKRSRVDDDSSTFHLVMEMERERLGSQVRASDANMVDSVVADVGERLPFPVHGVVGTPYKVSAPTDSPPPEHSDTSDEIKIEDLSPEGRLTLECLQEARQDLDKRCKLIQKSLFSLNESVNNFERKIKPLRNV